MHWSRKNYLFAWKGLYKGCHGYCNMVLETVEGYDLWISHSFFDMAGLHNDINMLQYEIMTDHGLICLKRIYNF
jgi:hypothetical protein